MLIGLRGVGKTVLLRELRRMAAAEDYVTIQIEAHEGKALGALVILSMREVLAELDRVAGVAVKVKRAWSVLRSFIGSMKAKIGEVEIELGVLPERGTADSGDIEIDLPQLFIAIGEAAEDRGRAFALFMDEAQNLESRELGALIMAMHQMQQRQLPVTLIGAGLPILPTLAGDSKSYAERLFDFPDIGALSPADVGKALQDPARDAGASFEPEALEQINRLTKGYPYFVQEWGYHSWNAAPTPVISRQVVERASLDAVASLDASFFRVRYERLTNAEKLFLRAMAELGPGPHRSGDIAQARKVNVKSIGPVRASLIQKGMIYSPAHGDLAFTVPLFDEFMKRAIPAF